MLSNFQILFAMLLCSKFERKSLTVLLYLTVITFECLLGLNRARLLGVYVVTPRPQPSLYGIIYVTWYTSHLSEPAGARFC